MTPQSEHDIEQLNRLIEATLDSAEGYRDATKASTISRFSPLFTARAGERQTIVAQLQAEVRRLGGTPEQDGTMLGAAQRWFNTLKNSVVGSEASVIAEVEAGEDHVKEVYEAALADGKLSADIRTKIQAAFVSIKAGHDQMRDLKKAQQAS